MVKMKTRIESTEKPKTVFVTVGTTKFIKLIDTVTSEEVLNVLMSQGFKRIIVQYGNGDPPPVPENSSLEWETYSFKDSVAEDTAAASLVISHAGAGSIVETLRAKVPMLVVINEDLMDNHQEELAHAMQYKNYLLSCTCGTLKDSLDSIGSKTFTPFPDYFPDMFLGFLNSVMGVW